MSRKAFVTGGSRGIGKGIVFALAKEGYDVAFTYASKEDAAKAVVKKVEEERTPRPPASETAATSSALEIHCIQAAMIGYWMPRRSVTTVLICFIKTSVKHNSSRSLSRASGQRPEARGETE